jgi:hypothetical protein
MMLQRNGYDVTSKPEKQNGSRMLMSVRPLVVTKAPKSARETSAADPMATVVQWC